MNTSHSCHLQLISDPQASYEVAKSERPSNSPQRDSNRKKRSVAEHTKYWRTGRTLKIAISRINDEAFDTVKNAINKWRAYVNLNFDFIDLDDNDELYEGDIRVYLAPLYNAAGSSLIGTDALAAPSHQPTMFIGTNYTNPDYESLVMHEFGHALGLMHEHQHPDANIPWDREKTYQVYQQLYGFSNAMVDSNVLPLARDNNKTYTAYDPHSVMHYEVLNICTVGDWELPRNKQLSAGDIAFARRVYP